jgi:alkylhydroperoxidase family enzyme
MPKAQYGRLPWYEPAEFTPEQQEFYAATALGPRMPATRSLPLVDAEGRMYGPFNALLATPAIAHAFHEVGRRLRYDSSFTPRGREVAILELSTLRRCGTEWYAHSPIGARVGLTEDELNALKTGAPAPTLDHSEQLIRKVTQSLARARDVDDALYAAAVEALGEKVLVELVMLIGYFDLLATFMTVFRSGIPDGLPDPYG